MATLTNERERRPARAAGCRSPPQASTPNATSSRMSTIVRPTPSAIPRVGEAGAERDERQREPRHRGDDGSAGERHARGDDRAARPPRRRTGRSSGSSSRSMQPVGDPEHDGGERQRDRAVHQPSQGPHRDQRDARATPNDGAADRADPPAGCNPAAMGLRRRTALLALVVAACLPAAAAAEPYTPPTGQGLERPDRRLRRRRLPVAGGQAPGDLAALHRLGPELPVHAHELARREGAADVPPEHVQGPEPARALQPRRDRPRQGRRLPDRAHAQHGGDGRADLHAPDGRDEQLQQPVRGVQLQRRQARRRPLGRGRSSRPGSAPT